jgi:hypothetical protein
MKQPIPIGSHVRARLHDGRETIGEVKAVLETIYGLLSTCLWIHHEDRTDEGASL